jgi:K+-transporting ATPase c subunit
MKNKYVLLVGFITAGLFTSLRVNAQADKQKFPFKVTADLVSQQNLVQITKSLTEKPQLLFPGEERINVLVLNLELNKLEQNVLGNK